MQQLNEIKDQREVVKTVGNFTNSLQQIAAMRMMKLRKQVLASRRFVQEATQILNELSLEKKKRLALELQQQKADSKQSLKQSESATLLSDEQEVKAAIIVVTSDIGLCGSYNTEITQKLETVTADYPNSDYYVIGKKGQSFMKLKEKKLNVTYYPYHIPEDVHIKDLRPIIGMFSYYDEVHILYSKYVNTTTRDVTLMHLSTPHVIEAQAIIDATEGRYIFEPSLDELIESTTNRLRYALFRQQILDSKLSLYTSQMVAMKAATDNADALLIELKQTYNKARRKIVDKKILEVQAGRSLWDTEQVTL